MSTLLAEYRYRHGINGIWPMNEGLLFFERNNEPALIAITSSFTKSINVCASCPKNSGGITLELFGLAKFPVCIQRITHTHMPPDSDVVNYVVNHVPNGEQYKPIVSTGDRFQEEWLWRFFIRSRAFNGALKESFWIDQMMWVAKNKPKHFSIFYQQVYSICMINRTYILSDLNQISKTS